MAQTKWLEKYALGLASIDAQHKRLVRLIGELEDALEQDDSENKDNAMGEVYDALVTYIEEHFSHEENLFRQHAYPDALEHHNEHGLFVSKLLGYRKKWQAGDADTPRHALTFLRVWLIKHIQVTDAEYVEFFRARGVN